MRKIFYGLSLVLLMNVVYTGCKCRQRQASFIPIYENELLPATNSLQKLPEW